jgi:capsular exopolysaccharide synthesis family protein
MEDKQSLIVRRIGKLSDALTESRLKKIGLLARRRQLMAVVKRDPLEMAVLPVLDNDTVQKLKDRFLQVYLELRSLQQNYGDKHPKVKEKQLAVAIARTDLAREVKNVVVALDAEIMETRDTEASIAGSLQGAMNEALELNKKEMSYRQLKREYENADKLYTMVLTRMKESDLSAQLRVNNIRPLDRAVESRVPVRPQVKINLIIGALVGLLLGIGLAFLVEATDTSVKAQEDVERVPGLVYLGLVPRIPGMQTVSRSRRRPAPRPESDLIVHRNPKSQVAESCRAIRTNLLFASPDQVMKRILVTSAGPREGKTTSAVSLAITMAQSGSRVVLVDTDMRRPRMHKVFQLTGGEGITSVLLGAVELDDVVKATEVPGLSLLTCGPTPPNPAEVCQSDRFKSLLDELNSRYDRVILDSPPVMVVTDAAVLSTQVDGVMLVARTGLTRKMDLREASRQLQDVGANLLGCVLNDMDLDKRRYGYYRYKRYGYKRYGYGHYGNYSDKEEAAG